jgi:hypothetical protein
MRYVSLCVPQIRGKSSKATPQSHTYRSGPCAKAPPSPSVRGPRARSKGSSCSQGRRTLFETIAGAPWKFSHKIEALQRWHPAGVAGAARLVQSTGAKSAQGWATTGIGDAS